MKIILKIIKILGRMILLVVSVILLAILAAAVAIALEKLILRLPEDYYFFEYSPVSEALMVYLIVVPAIIFFEVLSGRRKQRTTGEPGDMEGLSHIWRRLADVRFLLVVMWIGSLYCCFTSATIVTEDSIICCSPFSPSGITYDYSDVAQIRTGFGQKRFALFEYQKKGNFYYEIELDGKKKVFHVPDVNEKIGRYADETYLELEDFDRNLVSLGIPKQGEEKGWEACDLDQEYVDRFRRITALRYPN